MAFLTVKSLIEFAKKGGILGGIPDPIIPGYETVNGSLGHGLGVATGIGLALKAQKKIKTYSYFAVMVSCMRAHVGRR